jgi:hypothetical protein
MTEADKLELALRRAAVQMRDCEGRPSQWTVALVAVADAWRAVTLDTQGDRHPPVSRIEKELDAELTKELESLR